MMRRLLPIAAAVSLIGAAALAVPAVAVEPIDESGKVGVRVIRDKVAKPGVVCRFEDREGLIDDELNKVKVRRVATYGQRHATTWVGYRFTVWQRSWPSMDYVRIHKSAIVKKRASKDDPASFGWRSWSLPEDLVASDYRVIVHFLYYEKGSRKSVEGKVRGVMEVHRHKHPESAPFVVGKPGDGGECYYNFWT